MDQASGMDLVRRWRRACFAIDAVLRPAYLRAEFGRHPDEEVAAALDRMCFDAEQADSHAQELLVAVVDGLAAPGMAGTVGRLRNAASRNALVSLARLLRRPFLSETDEAREVHGAEVDADSSHSPLVPERTPDYGYGRPLALGERKALARRPTRELMAKLLADPHPAVIRALLDNPKLVEQDVLELVIRRPGSKDVLAVVARNRRWSRRRRIRMAIILNPHAPLAVTLPLLALLVRAELAEVASACPLDRVLRSEARDRLIRRPPYSMSPANSKPV